MKFNELKVCRSLVEGDVIPFKPRTVEPQVDVLTQKEIAATKKQIRAAVGSGPQENGRMGFVMWYAVGTVPGDRRRAYDSAVAKLTALFGEPQSARSDNEVRGYLLGQQDKKQGTRRVDLSNNTELAWEIKDHVIVHSALDPSDYGCTIRFFRFK